MPVDSRCLYSILYITAREEGALAVDETETCEMTKEEMQRFLNREAEKGTGEVGALRALAEILGIRYPRLEDSDSE